MADETGTIDRPTFVEGLASASGRRFDPDEVARVHDAWLLGEYEGVAAVFDIGARKPDPAAFRAVEVASGVRGKHVVFLDDLEQNILGARRAGWTAIAIDPHADPAAQMLAFLSRGGRGSDGRR